ncbi:MAG: OmpP1/FadL family transporter [Lacibacter sp.]
MKPALSRSLIIFSLVCAGNPLFAQDALDALRFGQWNPVNSARIRAIGGANASLGGDISATFINPAGLAQFKTNEVVFTPGLFLNGANMQYNDSSFRGRRSALNNGVTGVILSWNNRFRSSNIRNTTFSFAVNQVANFNSNFSYSGRNLQSSYSEKWVEELAFNRVTNINTALTGFPAGASLAFENYLVDTIQSNGNIIGYRTNAETQRMPLDQTFRYETRGGIQEAAVALAWNNQDKFMYGVTIGLPFVNFQRHSFIEERDGSGNTNNDFARFTLNETFSTRGGGINAKLGMIFKPVEHFRVGLTFHTPTVFTLTDRTFADLETDVEGYARRITGDPNRSSVFRLNTHDITGGADYTYSYTLTTPWRAAASVSYVFREIKDIAKQKGFITADVELVNYRSMRYSANEFANSGEIDYFRGVNNDIVNLYRMALNARIGGEVKFKTFMVRGGFNYLGSPYVKNALPDNIKAWTMTPSLGIGYRDKGIFADLTYAHAFGRNIHFPYMLGENSYPFARNNFFAGQLVATVGLKF